MDKTAVAAKAAEVATHAGGTLTGENVVYLMGLSFMLGSLFTVLILVMLDFMKRDRGIDKD